ncbi:hypothetical protein BC832DRAFT_590431 [Gaertneriomyces semiglobifer]|nr:hypothetical protein BC832DRAFT_590431 [Gaertneriomyces semiglobifer]
MAIRPIRTRCSSCVGRINRKRNWFVEASRRSGAILLHDQAGTRRGLTSTVEAGTAFERDASKVLEQYGLLLRQVGGRGDRGIDLRGTWHLPLVGGRMPSGSIALVDERRPDVFQWPVIVQCKNERIPIGPKYIRELEGTIAKETVGTIALLASSKGFSHKAVDLLFRSSAPLGLAVIEGQTCAHFAVNRSLRQLLPGLAVHNLNGRVILHYFERTIG